MSRAVWTVLVLMFAAMAVAGPLQLIRFAGDSGGEKPSGPGADPGGNRVGMAGLAFSPAELTVARGTEVLFDNDDAAPHTVTSGDGAVDSGILNPGKAFRLVVNQPITYSCSIHPSMTAKVLLLG